MRLLGTSVGTLALWAEETEHLGFLVARASEPVRSQSVELGNLARFKLKVAVGKDQPHATGEHV